jgi:hypothetical protein
MVVVGVGGYVLGIRQAGVTVLSGTAQMGDREVIIALDGWSYGFEGTVPEWHDSSGAWHDSGWPNCLDSVGSTRRIQFGEVPVTTPDGMSTREVVWASCVT